jgi:hypothetical protein
MGSFFRLHFCMLACMPVSAFEACYATCAGGGVLEPIKGGCVRTCVCVCV